MLNGLGIWIAVLFDHVFDQVNPPPRTVEFITQNLIGRAGGRAKSTMHTAAQNFIRAGGAGIFQLGICEIRLH